jgi:hypothetical protein
MRSALICQKEVLNSCPIDHPNRVKALLAVSMARLERWECLGNPEDKAFTDTHMEKCMKLCPPGHVEHCFVL